MENVPSLLDFLHQFISTSATPNEAYTLSCLVELGPHVMDALFIDATPGAAEIYGRTYEQLIGNWLSLTHPLEVFNHAREMAACRHYGGDIPTAYIGSVLRPNGQIVPVIKDTRQLLLHDKMYWFTRIVPASDNPNLPSQESIRVPSFEDPLNLNGNYSMAEVQSRLNVSSDDAEQEKALHVGNISTIIGRNITESKGKFMGEVRQNQFAHNGVQLLFGRPLQRISTGQLVAECQVCGHVWVPRKQDEILVYDEADRLIRIVDREI